MPNENVTASGVRRINPKGRPILSRGPIITALVALSGVTGLLAVGSLVFALAVFSGRIDTIQAARQQSAFDTCRILDAVIGASGASNQRAIVYNLRGRISGYVQFGGKGQKQKVSAFIDSVGLADCHAYAKHVRTGTTLHPPKPILVPRHTTSRSTAGHQGQ